MMVGRVSILFVATAIFAFPAIAQEATVAQTQLGCQHRDIYQTMAQAAIDNDTVAFSRGLNATVPTGECRIFRPGESVVVVERDVITIKIRPRGSRTAYWAPIDILIAGK
jgi:hypothetical protein